MKKTILLLTLSLLNFAFAQAQSIKSVEEIDTLDISNVKIAPIDFEDNEDYSTFELFKTEKSSQARVFFAGENHNYRYTNSKNQIKLFKFLNNTYGVNTLILEFGYSNGWIVNKYINSEKDSNLLELLENYTYKEYSDFYTNLRTYNLSLPDSMKLTVLGVDVERFYNLNAKILSMLLPSTTPHDSILISVESLRSLGSFLDKYQSNLISQSKESMEDTEDEFKFSMFTPESYYISSTLYDIVEDYDKHIELFKSYLGENFESFNTLITELKDKEIYEDYERQPQQHVYRELYMYNKLKKYLIDNPNAKFFGQFGRCHIGQEIQDEACSWHLFNSIATRLNKSDLDQFKGKVVSFAYFYKDDITFDEMLENAGSTRKIINRSLEKDSTSVIEINNDSLIFGNFAMLYDFIIVNSIDKDSETENLDIKDIAPYTYERKAIFNIYGGPVFFKQDFSNLNNFFSSNNFQQYSKPLSYNFGFGMGEIGNIMINYTFSVTQEQTLKNPLDTAIAKISGSAFCISEGFDVFKSKYFLLVPNIRFSGATYTIEMSDAPEKLNPKLDEFGGIETNTFTNPSFLLGGAVDFIIRYKFIGLGSSVGYDFDVSNKKWLNSSANKIDSSPEFSHSNFFYNVNLFLSFNF